MGWLHKLFGGNQQSTSEIIPEKYTDKEYEQYMMGFRSGYPVAGDTSTVPENNHPMFQRGLADGRASFEERRNFEERHGKRKR